MIGRYFQFVRALALVALLAVLAGQVSSGISTPSGPATNPPASGSPVPTARPQPTATATNGTTPPAKLSFCDPPFTLSAGKTPDKLSKLIEARRLEDDSQLQSSALAYEEAIDSTDETVRGCALAGYERVRRRMVPATLSFCDPPLTLSAGKTPDKLSKLIDAHNLEKEWQLDKSALSYKDASDSSDKPVRDCALAGYDRVNKKMDEVPWTFRWFTPYRWEKQYGLTWKLSSIMAELVAVLALCFAFLSFYCSRRNAYFLTTLDLGGQAPVAYFGAQMRAALLDIAPILADEGGRQMTGSGSYGPPAQELKDVGSALPTVAGINVNSVVTALLALVRYFGYQVDSGLALVDGKACAFASIRRRGNTLGHYELEEPLPAPPASGTASTAIQSVTVSLLAARLAYLVSAKLAWK
jgi:hypothetical protein